VWRIEWPVSQRALDADASVQLRRLSCWACRIYLFTFDKQRLYTRLGWSTLEDASYGGRSGTVMVQRLAG
jgi:hypothetical protein